MSKLTMPRADVARLSVRERVLLLCVASSTDWQRAGVPGETVTGMIVKGLVVRGAVGQLELTDRGRVTVLAMLGTLWD